MALEIGKERIEIARDGRRRLHVQWLADSRSEVFSLPDSVDGLRMEGTVGSPWISKQGRYVATVVYQGLPEDPGEEWDSARIVTESKLVKIEQFPDRELLVDEYGAYLEDDRLKFPPTLPDGSGLDGLGSAGLGTKGLSRRGGEVQNPLYNVTHYPVDFEVALHRYTRRKVPARARKDAHTVVQKLPPVFEYSGSVENWYVLPPQLDRQRGGFWTVEVRYEQVDDFNDRRALLDLLKGGSRGRGAGAGLLTGSL